MVFLLKNLQLSTGGGGSKFSEKCFRSSCMAPDGTPRKHPARRSKEEGWKNRS